MIEPVGLLGTALQEPLSSALYIFQILTVSLNSFFVLQRDHHRNSVCHKGTGKIGHVAGLGDQHSSPGSSIQRSPISIASLLLLSPESPFSDHKRLLSFFADTCRSHFSVPAVLHWMYKMSFLSPEKRSLPRGSSTEYQNPALRPPARSRLPSRLPRQRTSGCRKAEYLRSSLIMDFSLRHHQHPSDPFLGTMIVPWSLYFLRMK